ncbi:MAG TPA: aspartate aminotransferase family protein, partial [Porticoccaceae bacterium]|nr:aspartate aminotransferase family protein [Porticoccaceae bacterium]
MTSSALMDNYGPRSLSIAKGEGVWVWDDQGTRYLDALAGIAVCGLGHCHPAVSAAIQAQSQNLVHCSNLYNIAAR